MKSSFSILIIVLLCISTTVQSAAAEGRVDCLKADRHNLEDVCRNECAKEADSVAFSVSHDNNNDSCLCYKTIEGLLGTYKASGDRESQWTCYSMERAKTQIVDYGDCIIDSSRYGTKHNMQKCDKEHKVDCVDKERRDVYGVCHQECLKHNSAAFAVSDEDLICRCYPKMEDGREYTASAESDMHAESPITCFSMDGPTIKVLDYGDCVPSDIYNLPGMVREQTMKRCPQEEKLLRGSVSV